MSTDRSIGSDVGGTNTDAAPQDQGRVVQSVNAPTTPDVTVRILTAFANSVANLKRPRGRPT